MNHIKSFTFVPVVVALILFTGKAISLDWRVAIMVLWPLIIAAFFIEHQGEERGCLFAKPRGILSAVWLAISMVILCSDMTSSSRFFILNWWPSTFSLKDVFSSGVFRFNAVTIVFLLLIWRADNRRLKRLLYLTVVLAAALCFYGLMSKTGGAALYRDDHPSFMFRFWAFARSFPSPSYYNPFWNAGNIETASISSGLQTLGVWFWPFWRTMEVHEIYTRLTGFALTFIIPLLAMIALRLAGGGWIAAGVAALLALAPGRFFFIWTLHYGTIPSGFSAAFALPLCGSLIHILQRDKPSPWSVIFMAISLAGLASWPPGALMATPIALATMLTGGAWSKGKLVRLGLGAILAIALLMPGLLGIWLHVDIGGFVSAEGHASRDWMAGLQKGFGRLASLFSSSHVLIVFPGILGAFFLPRESSRSVVAISLAGLIVMTGWGLTFKPILQLNRAAVPLLFVAIIPAAIWLEDLLQKSGRAWVPLKAATLSLLVMGAHSASRIYANQWEAPYKTMNDDVAGMVLWIQENAPEESRVMFAGPTVHAYAGGHVAYLPVMTGRSMMACDYYHFSPKKVEYEYPPKNFRGSDDAIFNFLDLYNVGAILTYHEYWKDFFRKYPERFEETGVFGEARKRVGFKVLRPVPGWFISGSGEVQQEINALHVRVDNPNEPCVLRFSWVNGFKSDQPVKLQPYDTGGGAHLIWIDPRGHPSFTLRWSQWAQGHAVDFHRRELANAGMDAEAVAYEHHHHHD